MTIGKKMNESKLSKYLKYVEEGDDTFLHKLNDYCFPRIVYHVSKNYSSAIADDVAQEFFLRLKEKSLPACEERVSAWILSCCSAIAQERMASAETEHAESDGFAAFAAEKAQDQAFVSLDETDQKIVYFRYQKKFRLNEIASLLQLPYTMVRKRHSRLKEKTGDLLAELEQGKGSRTEE